MKRPLARRCRKRSRRGRCPARGPVRYHEAVEHQSSSGTGQTCLRRQPPATASRLYRLLHHPYPLCLSTRRRAGPEGRAGSGDLRFRRHAGWRRGGRWSASWTRGTARSIGLSDITLEKLREIVSVARIKPAIVQVESHPYLPEWELLDFCREHGIVLQAFAALGHAMEPNLLADPVITSHRTACAQDAGSSGSGLGRPARHRFPDHLDQTSAHPGEL